MQTGVAAWVLIDCRQYVMAACLTCRLHWLCHASQTNGRHAGQPEFLGLKEHAHDCITPPALQGYDLARVAALKFLEEFKQSVDPGDREVMRCVARTSLRTKLAQASSALDGTTPVADWMSHRIGLCYRSCKGAHMHLVFKGVEVTSNPAAACDHQHTSAHERRCTFLVQSMADRLTDIVTDAVMTIRKPEEPIDLYMVSLESQRIIVLPWGLSGTTRPAMCQRSRGRRVAMIAQDTVKPGGSSLEAAGSGGSAGVRLRQQRRQ